MKRSARTPSAASAGKVAGRATCLLHGQAIRWASWDRSGIVTAMLQAVATRAPESRSGAVQLTRVEHLPDLLNTAVAQSSGIVFWAVAEDTPLKEICESLAAVESRADSALRLCYLAPESARNAGLLVEAGAQIVVSQLPRMQTVFRRLLSLAPSTKHGYHPLTHGLVDRLPWPTLSNNES